jgi:hypothetical protein
MILTNPVMSTEALIVMTAISIWLAYLWYQDRFGNKKLARPETCALSSQVVEKFEAKINASHERHLKIEDDIMRDKKETVDRFCELVESNIRAVSSLDSSIKILSSVVEGLRNAKR